jgi:hypothetical protein
MKGILVTIGVAIGLVIAIYGAFGDMFTAIDFFNAAKPAIEGNYTDAVDKVTDFTSDYIIGVVYWTLALAFLSSILAIFGIKIRSG